jgi:hypothetical protein
MNSSDQVTLEALLIALWKKMIVDNETKDYAALNRLFVTFETLLEGLSWHRKGEASFGVDLAIYQLTDRLADFAREAATGVPWKAKLPSEEEIRTAFSGKAE